MLTPVGARMLTRDGAMRLTIAGALVVCSVVAGCNGAARGDARESAPHGDAQAVEVAVAPAATGFDQERAWAHLVRQVEFGPRPAGSEALAQTRRYLMAQLEAAGVPTREQAFTARTPVGEVPMVNVIGRIPGERDERIALASHYDTKRAPFRFVGANDGASSTAAVLELARVLATRRNAFTIEILLFDGEEAVNWDWEGDDNTYGSRHYVQAARADGTLAGLRGLVLLDMVGGRSPTFRREANSTPWLVDILWETAARLGHRRHFSNELIAIEDDHIPFLRAGVPAVDIIQDIADYPAWHTAGDDLDQVSAETLQMVGDVVLAAWPGIERRLLTDRR
jgi:glutaminyl-peptide cyclotransferase